MPHNNRYRVWEAHCQNFGAVSQRKSKVGCRYAGTEHSQAYIALSLSLASLLSLSLSRSLSLSLSVTSFKFVARGILVGACKYRPTQRAVRFVFLPRTWLEQFNHFVLKIFIYGFPRQVVWPVFYINQSPTIKLNRDCHLWLYFLNWCRNKTWKELSRLLINRDFFPGAAYGVSSNLYQLNQILSTSDFNSYKLT